MFGFLRTSKKIKREEDKAEEKLINDLRMSLGDEPPTTTNLKNRLRIIDLEDKVNKIEKKLKSIGSITHKLIQPKKKAKK